jgi:hypothetical protein
MITGNPIITVLMGLHKKNIPFSLRLNTRLSWFNYSQTLNSVTTTNERTSQNVGLLFKRPTGNGRISVGYNKGYISFRNHKIKFETDALTLMHVIFFKL